ncbi:MULTISPECIES: DNA cytosine methyltransferase [Roseobacteraceae]|uniref:Cytosine-specific methyltransferase n=1 Tax=Pseudosulfitobacter pseudonitzschiae TaxID=1402135 RepID=A0A221K1R1_9RHOB|nr:MULTISPECIES: DNA cytosine methyltransferase [Roseobacteraceae]ASM72924.1 modification methylase BanI [Pseudosulfitobacter pseudonitzschiae]
MFDSDHNALQVVSLFSGCGGLDYGFARTGFNIRAAFDNDAHAVSCYNLNHSSIAKQQVIDNAWMLETPADVIVAGPPCQGFSTGGGYKENDPRNSLLLATCELVVESKAKLAVIENVAALTNKRNQDYLQQAIQTLTEGGYSCSVQVYCAADFGVAQRRKRTVIFARFGKAPFRCPTPRRSHAPTVESAFHNMSSSIQAHNPKFPANGSKHEVIAKRIGIGQKLCNVRGGEASVPTWDIPEWFGHASKHEKKILTTIRSLRRRNRKRNFGDADPVSFLEISAEIPEITQNQLALLIDRGYMRKYNSLYDLRDTFNGKYRRLDPDDVSPTVDTRFGDIQLFLHPSENRGLTVREAARLQGFPDDFIFPEREKEAFRLIGNAVPPPMSIQIAKACRELLA